MKTKYSKIREIKFKLAWITCIQIFIVHMFQLEQYPPFQQTVNNLNLIYYNWFVLVGYPLSSVNQRVFERTVNFNGATNNTTMHAALPTSRPTLQANRTSRLTDEPQFIGELQRNRSRSNSSTASSSYGQSAARRYSAKNSPAPTRRHGCNEELRVQVIHSH